MDLSAASVDASGRLTVLVTSVPALPVGVFRYNLRLKLLSENDVLKPEAAAEVSSGLDVTFVSPALAAGGEVPSRCDLFWGPNGETYLGRVACMRQAPVAAASPQAPAAVAAPPDTAKARRAGCAGVLALVAALGLALVTGAVALWMVL